MNTPRAVSVLKASGDRATEETGNDRPAAPFSNRRPPRPFSAADHDCPKCHRRTLRWNQIPQFAAFRPRFLRCIATGCGWNGTRAELTKGRP